VLDAILSPQKGGKIPMIRYVSNNFDKNYSSTLTFMILHLAYIKVSFSTRFPILDFLQELFKDFPKDKFSHLEGFKIGFTHFIMLDYMPNEQIFLEVYKRRAAIVCQRNQEGVDLVIPIVHEDGNDIGAVIIQVFQIYIS
jgi:hypothetical protein